MFLIISSKIFGQRTEYDYPALNNPLFQSDDPIEISIEADFTELIKTKALEEPEEKEALLILNEENNYSEEFRIKINARGVTRRTSDICSFPPLLLNFKRKATKGTFFDGQNKLKLVTFCKDTEQYETFVLQEYLIYRTYNILTDTSFNVRLAKITYHDTGRARDITTRFGFLIEDIDDLADRLGGSEIDLLLPNHDLCDHINLDRFIIFQYMIGNTDWWIARPKLHNVKLISIDSGPPIPIPYDFDYSGVINTPYAVPSDGLPIKSVRQRLFRGFCRKKGDYEEILSGFVTHKAEIYQLYRDFQYLNDQTKNIMLQYYDQFYNIIEDPRKVKQIFYDSCPVRHTHLHEK